jgi:glycosyltransferase involved in cell wall biosynthesis
MRGEYFRRLTGRSGELKLADEARDERDWPKARDLYRQVLDNYPTRAPIWVQYGHALKECGDVAAAQAAYEKAIGLDPEVADTHVQLGHSLKLQGDMDGALEAYRRAYALDPASRAAAVELQQMDTTFRAAERLAEAQAAPAQHEAILIDLSDVFFYLKHHDTLSGIQRVQMGVAEALIGLGDKAGRPVRFVVGGEALGGYVELRTGAVARLAAELANFQVSHDRLRRIMDEEELAGTALRIARGDVMVVLGAFWVIENAIERFVRVKQQGGRLVVLIHDLIPVTNPEYCEASLTDSFKMFCGHVLQIADLVLTVSDYSGRKVSEFLASIGLAPPPIRTLRSAHKSLDVREAVQPSIRMSGLLSRPFVLYVSTIEIRKNHTLLFRIWKELIRRHGADKVPKLIWVGRQGWRVSDLMDQLESTRFLEGHIQLVHGLSDAELAMLYKAAVFTAFPSFEEGWGLPIGESLIFGTPVAASNASSIPEVAGDLVAYEDPHNLWASYALYERMIFDAGFRGDFASRIAERFTPRTWTEVAADLVALLDEHAGAGAVGAVAEPRVVLAPGRLFRVGHRGDVTEYLRSGLGERVHFMFDDGWGPVEEHVRWVMKQTASLRFEVGYDAPCEIMLALFVDTAPWLGATTLGVTVNDERFAPVEGNAGETCKYVVRCTPAQREVVINFDLVGDIAYGPDPRPLTYGLRAIGYAGVADNTARAELVEGMLFEAVGVRTLYRG